MASSINTFLFCNAFPGDGKLLAWGACPHGSRGPRAWGPLCRWIPADLHGVRHSLSGFHLATENLWEWQIKCYEPYLNRGSREPRRARRTKAVGQCGAQPMAMGGLGVGRGASRALYLQSNASWDRGRRLTCGRTVRRKARNPCFCSMFLQ